MKTLIVVSALVALAFAAPALPGEGLESTDRAQDWQLSAQPSLPDSLKRERKSPSEIIATSMPISEVHNIDAGASTPSGRSFALKKPVIVKKKYGYRLYRDSEEEKAHADSNETCGRQVKVKLCDEDGKFRTSTRGHTQEMSDIHTSDDDIKHSIKMAKEAVENLQKDLKKMEERSSDMKMAHESQSDTELHEDIEVARQALKHIHENFGNMESMSLHATSTRNSEDMHDVHLMIAKTEEERMAQWKEALENIQKNVEIARNIEDSFKAAGNQDSMLHLDQSAMTSTINENKLEKDVSLHESSSEVDHMRLAHNAALETHDQENVANEATTLNMANEHLTENNAKMAHNTGGDMNTAPSEMIAIHLDDKNEEVLRSENHKIEEIEKAAEVKEELNLHTENKDSLNKDTITDHHQHHHHHHHHNNQEKNSELNADMLTDQSEHHLTLVPSVKAVEEETDTKLDLQKDATFKTSENIPEGHVALTDTIKSMTLDVSGDHQRSADQTQSKTNIDNRVKHLEQDKNAEKMTSSDDMIDFLAKSADHLDKAELKKEDLHQEHKIELAKVAENSEIEHKEHLVENLDSKLKETIEVKPLDNIPKSAEQLEHSHFHNIAEHNENVMSAKSVDHMSLEDHQKEELVQNEEMPVIETASEMKAAEEHLHHLHHMHNAHWEHENRHLDHLSSMKAAEDFDKEFRMSQGHVHGHGIAEHTLEHLRNSHYAEHSQIPHKVSGFRDFELAKHGQPHSHHPNRYHHSSMTNSQLHEMTGMGSAMHSNFHPSMRDALEDFGSDHMFRWKPAHESARVAYGSGLSNSISSIGSSGAVGVFPNANTGGCGIPLLLSCSPSVVSGSLAKAHSAGASYSAPAYRTEDDFGFHNKRDIKKTNDIRTTNVLRTPSIVKQKSSIALENKL